MDKTYEGLKLVANNPSVDEFRKQLGNMLLDGLLSKEYVIIDDSRRPNRLNLSLKGVRCLLDHEGMKYD